MAILLAILLALSIPNLVSPYELDPAQHYHVSAARFGGTLEIDCDQTYFISEIVFASFGTPKKITEGVYEIGQCHAPDSVKIATQSCVGKKSCYLPADRTTFAIQDESCALQREKLVIVAHCSLNTTAPQNQNSSGNHINISSSPSTHSTKPKPATYKVGRDFSAMVSENQTAVLSCPGAIASIRFASYGTPVISANNSELSNGSCNAKTSKDVVERKCLGKSNCTVAASNSEFGDPCRWQRKFLAVIYVCNGQKAHTPVKPPAPAPAPVPSKNPSAPVPSKNPSEFTVVSEGRNATLSCPGSVASILFASYGTPNISENDPKMTQGSCHAENSTVLVQMACIGKPTCEISASNSVFGDPCRKTKKYLGVMYTCGPSVKQDRAVPAAPAPAPALTPSVQAPSPVQPPIAPVSSPVIAPAPSLAPSPVYASPAPSLVYVPSAPAPSPARPPPVPAPVPVPASIEVVYTPNALAPLPISTPPAPLPVSAPPAPLPVSTPPAPSPVRQLPPVAVPESTSVSGPRTTVSIVCNTGSIRNIVYPSNEQGQSCYSVSSKTSIDNECVGRMSCSLSLTQYLVDNICIGKLSSDQLKWQGFCTQ